MLPGLLHARKLQRRVASTGFDFPGVEGPLGALQDEVAEAVAGTRLFRQHGPDHGDQFLIVG